MLKSDCNEKGFFLKLEHSFPLVHYINGRCLTFGDRWDSYFSRPGTRLQDLTALSPKHSEVWAMFSLSKTFSGFYTSARCVVSK